MANTLQADFLSACLIATSRPSRSWCWMTKARTGHWKFLSPLLREPWAEISLDSSGEGCRSREDPTSAGWKEQSGVEHNAPLIFKIVTGGCSVANLRRRCGRGVEARL